MNNPKKDKIIFNLWLSKTQSREMLNAIEDDDKEKAVEIFLESFKLGFVGKG